MVPEWRTASIIGREHVRLGRNNQDAVVAMGADGVSVAVVCDGCGSERRSEVGAHLGARFLAGWLRQHGAAHAGPALPERVSQALLEFLRQTALALDPAPELLADTIGRYFLFTWLAAVHLPGRTIILGQGDGAFVVDGATRVMDSGAQNAPDYAAYELLDGRRRMPRVHHDGPAYRVALATDGLAPALEADPRALAPLFEDPVVWRNPVHLSRRLTVLAEAGQWRDDATLALSQGAE